MGTWYNHGIYERFDACDLKMWGWIPWPWMGNDEPVDLEMFTVSEIVSFQNGLRLTYYVRWKACASPPSLEKYPGGYRFGECITLSQSKSHFCFSKWLLLFHYPLASRYLDDLTYFVTCKNYSSRVHLWPCNPPFWLVWSNSKLRSSDSNFGCKVTDYNEQLNQLSFFLDCAVKQYFISLSSLPRLDYVPVVAFYRRLLFWFLFDILWTMWISFNDFCFYFFLGCALKHIVTLWIVAGTCAESSAVFLECGVSCQFNQQWEINLQVALSAFENEWFQ